MPGSSVRTSCTAAPAYSDSASDHGPSTSRPATGRPQKFVVTGAPSSIVPETSSPSGKPSVNRSSTTVGAIWTIGP